MIAVVQRVTRASVTVEEKVVGEVGPGMAVLVAVHSDDTQLDISWTANKIATLRIFSNGDKYFDLDVQQSKGGILLVSNFTVAADTRSGRRPGLSPAAAPDLALPLFNALADVLRATGIPLATGSFGADMKVLIENDGPVTFLLDSREARKPLNREP